MSLWQGRLSSLRRKTRHYYDDNNADAEAEAEERVYVQGELHVPVVSPALLVSPALPAALAQVVSLVPSGEIPSPMPIYGRVAAADEMLH